MKLDRRFLSCGSPSSVRFALGLALGHLASACRCEEERPYTPFTVASSLPGSEPSPRTAGGPPPNPGPKNGYQVERLERPSLVYSSGGAELRAPEGGKIESLVKDKEGRPLYAWVSGPRSTAGLYPHQGSGALRSRVLEYPEFLPSTPDCEKKASLYVSGVSTLSLRFDSQCESSLLPGTSASALVIWDLKSQSKTAGFRWPRWSPEDQMEVLADGADRDGDGSDDLALKFNAPGRIDLGLEFVWLRRPAGLSRQKEYPEKGFAKHASDLSISSERKKERASVPPRVEFLRRAFGSLCRESRTAQFLSEDRSPLECGSVGSSLGKLALSMGRALLGEGELSKAHGELSRFDWFGAPKAAEQTVLERAFMERVQHGTPALKASVSLPAAPIESGVRRERLSFREGQLLWEADNTRKTIWPIASAAPAEAELPEEDSVAAPEPPAESFLRGPGGRLLSAVVPSCERSSSLLVLSTDTGTFLPGEPFGLLSPRPGHCGDMVKLPLDTIHLGWNEAKPIFLCGGEIWNQKPTSESYALAGPMGVLILGSPSPQIWQTGAIPAGSLCAVDDAREHVACHIKDEVKLWGRPETWEPKKIEGQPKK